jgi:hypothetical protein
VDKAVSTTSRTTKTPRRAPGHRDGAEPTDSAPPNALPFAGLAYLHYRWRKALESSSPNLKSAEEAYKEARLAFEAEHGVIVNEYWCWHVPSAVALTEKPRPKVVSWFLRPKIAFHRASDWATKDRPDVAEQLHRCDELAVRATQVLSGLRRRICLHLVMTSAAHLLSFVDARAAHESPPEVLKQEKEALDEAHDYYTGAANGQAQIIYFAGMTVLAVLIGAFALLGSLWLNLPGISPDREFYGCIAAGALGALISVVQRINSGQFNLTYDVGRPYIAFLGGLRPVLGASFGLIFYFAVTSEVLNIFTITSENGTKRFFSLLVIAFLAGFSERWAQDTLTSLGQGSGKTDPATPPARS